MALRRGVSIAITYAGAHQLVFRFSARFGGTEDYAAGGRDKLRQGVRWSVNWLRSIRRNLFRNHFAGVAQVNIVQQSYRTASGSERIKDSTR